MPDSERRHDSSWPKNRLKSVRDECAEVELRQDEVSVEGIPIGRIVEVAPQTRDEDSVLIVPVLEEQVVVTTRLFLKEEIRITKRSRIEIVRGPM